MEFQKLTKQEVQILIWRCQGEKPQVIAKDKLNIGTTPYYNLQYNILEKLDVDGEGREKFDNFKSMGGCDELLQKVKQEDIDDWERRKYEIFGGQPESPELISPTTSTPTTSTTSKEGSKTPPTTRKYSPVYLLIFLIPVLVIAGIFIGRWLNSSPPPQVVTELVVITNTPEPTKPPEPTSTVSLQTEEPTSAPTAAFTPTSMDIVVIPPSLTPFIPTEIPEPTNMRLGDVASDNRVSLKLTDQIKYNQEYYGSSAIWFYLEFANRTDQDILLTYNPGDFTLKDNLGRDYECWYILRYPYAEKRHDMQPTVERVSTYKFTLGCGPGLEFDTEVISLILSAEKFSSLTDLVWEIEIPR